MWNRLIILILSVVTYTSALAQTSVSGVVKTTKGNGVDFASVVASPVNAPKTILASAFTDENGRFQMSVKSNCDSLILKASNYDIATNGLDLYDSEARWYDSLLGRTTTMDPLAEKYYSLSPYLWCAGNPVNINDIDGNTITAIIEDNEFFIRKGSDGFYKLFDKYNNIYNPNRNSYGSNLISDINSIASATNGNDLLSFLVNNENNVSIISSNDGFFANITSNIIGYDEFDSEGGLSYFYTSGYSTIRPQYVALAHELAHIEDLWKGSFDTSTWYNSGNTTIYNAEKYAVFKENQIRKEHNQPLRLYYEHFTYNLNGINLYIPNRVSKIVLGLSDYNYLLKNYSR